MHFHKLNLTSVVLFALACGAPVAPSPRGAEQGMAEGAEDDSGLSATHPGVVSVRADPRRCVRAGCGGYFVRELGRATEERYVSGLDFSGSGLTDAEQTRVLEAPPEELLLRGKLGPVAGVDGERPFVVSEVYRGLPGVRAAEGDVFYVAKSRGPQFACVAAPCLSEQATKVNARANVAPVDFSSYAVGRAALTGVDTRWLVGQVRGEKAIVAGRFQEVGTPGEKQLDASQVYLRFPVQKPVCGRATALCGPGTQGTYARDENRCLVPATCAPPTFCPMVTPTCAEGYSLTRWTGASGCIEYACDPAFAAP